MTSLNPILITGCHRSGTTWVGKMLGVSSEIGYIHEPFNLRHRPGVCRSDFQHWFTYITTENQSSFRKDISKMLEFSYNPWAELKAIVSYRDALRMLRDYYHFQKYRLCQARPLIKDPIAFFSAEWFASEFNADVVMMIRHPAAFVSGLKVKNWEFDFSNFLDQPLLMRDYLAPFKSEILQFSQERRPIFEQGILLWRIFYSTIDEMRRKFHSWIFIRHEDLAKDPILGFQSLYSKLGLVFQNKQKLLIEQYTRPDNPNQSPATKIILGSNIAHSIKRSSKSSIQNWKLRLSPAEVKTIRIKTEAIASKFYTDEDWV